MGKKSKRKKSLSSPDGVNEIQLNKRINMADMSNSSRINTQVSGVNEQLPTPYTPQTVPTRYPENNHADSYMNFLQSSPSNLTQILNTQQASQYRSPDNFNAANGATAVSPTGQLINLGSTPYPQPLTQSFQTPVPPAYNQTILDKLESMNNRLNKLDSIESQVKSINEKVAKIDTRLTFLESSVHEQGRRLNDVEASRSYDSQVCQDLEVKQKNIEKSVQAEKKLRESIQSELEKIKNENSRLADEVVDLQSRSMRDNLLFFGLPEKSSPEERRNEDCHKLLMELFKNTLLLESPEDIKIDRVHRLGKYTPNKNRAIVAKFNFYQDKLKVKNAAYEHFQDTDYRVSDQFPRVIQEKRRQLIPELKKARSEGKDAIIVYDKLVIKGTRRRNERGPREATSSSFRTEEAIVTSHS